MKYIRRLTTAGQTDVSLSMSYINMYRKAIHNIFG